MDRQARNAPPGVVPAGRRPCPLSAITLVTLGAALLEVEPSGRRHVPCPIRVPDHPGGGRCRGGWGQHRGRRRHLSRIGNCDPEEDPLHHRGRTRRDLPLIQSRSSVRHSFQGERHDERLRHHESCGWCQSFVRGGGCNAFSGVVSDSSLERGLHRGRSDRDRLRCQHLLRGRSLHREPRVRGCRLHGRRRYRRVRAVPVREQCDQRQSRTAPGRQTSRLATSGSWNATSFATGALWVSRELSAACTSPGRAGGPRSLRAVSSSGTKAPRAGRFWRISAAR